MRKVHFGGSHSTCSIPSKIFWFITDCCCYCCCCCCFRFILKDPFKCIYLFCCIFFCWFHSFSMVKVMMVDYCIRRWWIIFSIYWCGCCSLKSIFLFSIPMKCVFNKNGPCVPIWSNSPTTTKLKNLFLIGFEMCFN